MALWRELRRSGAIPLGQAVWAVPELPAVCPLLERLTRLVEAANGTLLLLSARGFADGDVARLEQVFAATREEEWSEFDADYGKYVAELDKEERLGKYTLAELEEEEQSLDRLRRWYRELRSRDLMVSRLSEPPGGGQPHGGLAPQGDLLVRVGRIAPCCHLLPQQVALTVHTPRL
jgi:hypothetical protein